MITKTGLALRAYLRWFNANILTGEIKSTEMCVEKGDEIARFYNVSFSDFDEMYKVYARRSLDNALKSYDLGDVTESAV